MSKYNDIRNTEGVFIIAEIGVNYYDIAKKENITPIEAARLMIDEASKHGADAVKFQTYKAEKIASKNSPAYWNLNEEPTKSQYDLFKKFDKFNFKEYKELADYCKQKGIFFLSTPFDFEAADFLDELVPIHKISSSDITNIPFIEHVAKKKKPVFISTGASTIGEIETAVHTILSSGNDEICIMHCILDYPTSYENANLNMIKHLTGIFPDYVIGYSDHTKPDETMMTLTTAYLYGAKVIEKHFTLDKSIAGNDHYHAMDPDDLSKFANNVQLIQKINGQLYKKPLDCEMESRKQARRSIVTKVPLKKEEIITEDKITFKRPGTGISPRDLKIILGKKVIRDIHEDKLLQWDDFLTS